MALRAEQWLMIAVGGLGAYAVYRLVKNTQPPPEKVPILVDPSRPAQPTQPTGPLVLAQNWITSPGQVRNPNPMSGGSGLKHGANFKGRIEAPGSTREQLRKLLDDAGFVSITIYMNEAEARAGDAITLPGALVNPVQNQTRWFSAQFRGGNNSQKVPPQIVLLWLTGDLQTLAGTAGWGPWGYYPAYPTYGG